MPGSPPKPAEKTAARQRGQVTSVTYGVRAGDGCRWILRRNAAQNRTVTPTFAPQTGRSLHLPQRVARRPQTFLQTRVVGSQPERLLEVAECLK